MLWQNLLTIAHVGDSKALIAKQVGAAVQPEWLTVDHKVQSDPDPDPYSDTSPELVEAYTVLRAYIPTSHIHVAMSPCHHTNHYTPTLSSPTTSRTCPMSWPVSRRAEAVSRGCMATSRTSAAGTSMSVRRGENTQSNSTTHGPSAGKTSKCTSCVCVVTVSLLCRPVSSCRYYVSCRYCVGTVSSWALMLLVLLVLIALIHRAL